MAKIHTIDSDIIVHDGKQYRKVDRPVREGDAFIIPKESDMDYTAGKVYAITGIDGDGDPHFIDDVGDKYHLLSGEYYVLEPVAADLSALESELAAMKAKVAEMERQLAEVKKGAPEDRLKVGDYAVVLKAPGRLEIGDVVEITHEDAGGFDYNARRVLDGRTEVFIADELRRATDEEVAEAKRKLAEKENAEKWAAIGRKPGEFKKGDVVRVLPAKSGHVQGHAPGTIGVVAVADGTARPLIEANDNRYYDWIELVAPVESVVNLRVS
jgi:hypothetical protein